MVVELLPRGRLHAQEGCDVHEQRDHDHVRDQRRCRSAERREHLQQDFKLRLVNSGF